MSHTHADHELGLDEHIHPHVHQHDEEHVHPHSDSPVSALSRRTLLTGMAAGLGVVLCGSLIKPQQAYAAGSSVKLPGFSAFASSERAMTQPSLFDSTTTGRPSRAGSKTRSHDT